MKAILKKYFQEFADDIEFPTLIFVYETGKIITYNSLAEDIFGKNVCSINKIVAEKPIELEEIKDNNGSKIFYNRLYHIKGGNTSEIDIEVNAVSFEGMHIIIAFFQYSYKQAFVRHMKYLLPRFAWKDSYFNFQSINDSFITDLKFLHNYRPPLKNKDIVDAATSEKMMADDQYVLDEKIPLMHMLQLVKSETSEGYFCSINRMPLINSNGNVVGLIGTYHLIFSQDEYKVLYDAVLRSNNILNQLISKSDTVILSWRKDESYHLEYISSNISYYGYHPDQFYRCEVRSQDIIPEEDYKKILSNIENIRKDKIKFFVQKVTLIKGNGQKEPVKVIVECIKNKNNELYFECLVQRDISRSEIQGGKNDGYFHLALDTWEQSNKQEQLTKAISNNCKEFSVYYQPIVTVNNSSVIGIEALLRWNSSVYGTVNPLEFLSMSEYLGHMERLGYFVIRETLKTYGRLLKYGLSNIRIHINISLVQLFQPHFVTNLVTLTEENHIKREQIVLEIKEGLAMENMEFLKKVLLEIKRKGYRIALDNFGAGLMDINFIKDIPFDYIKLDKSFLETYASEKFNEALVIAMLEVIKSMKAETIVEGIETAKQYEFLLSHEVYAYQGYYFSKPVEKKKLLSSLK